MVHDQIDIPLCEEFKTGAFRQNHPEQRVCLLQSAFLPALHRVTVINAGTLYSVYTGLQSIRVTEFSAPVRQNIFKHGNEFKSSHTLFQTVKNKTDSAFRASVHQKGEEELLFGEKHSQQGLF